MKCTTTPTVKTSPGRKGSGLSLGITRFYATAVNGLRRCLGLRSSVLCVDVYLDGSHELISVKKLPGISEITCGDCEQADGLPASANSAAENQTERAGATAVNRSMLLNEQRGRTWSNIQ